MKCFQILRGLVLSLGAMSLVSCGGSSSDSGSSSESYEVSQADALRPYVGKWDLTESNGAAGNVTYYVTIQSSGSASVRIDEWGAGYTKTVFSMDGVAEYRGGDIIITRSDGEYAQFQGVDGTLYTQDGERFSRR